MIAITTVHSQNSLESLLIGLCVDNTKGIMRLPGEVCFLLISRVRVVEDERRGAYYVNVYVVQFNDCSLGKLVSSRPSGTNRVGKFSQLPSDPLNQSARFLREAIAPCFAGMCVSVYTGISTHLYVRCVLSASQGACLVVHNAVPNPYGTRAYRDKKK